MVIIIKIIRFRPFLKIRLYMIQKVFRNFLIRLILRIYYSYESSSVRKYDESSFIHHL